MFPSELLLCAGVIYWEDKILPNMGSKWYGKFFHSCLLICDNHNAPAGLT